MSREPSKPRSPVQWSDCREVPHGVWFTRSTSAAFGSAWRAQDGGFRYRYPSGTVSEGELWAVSDMPRGPFVPAPKVVPPAGDVPQERTCPS